VQYPALKKRAKSEEGGGKYNALGTQTGITNHVAPRATAATSGIISK
jgi:hypothetical protein